MKIKTERTFEPGDIVAYTLLNHTDDYRTFTRGVQDWLVSDRNWIYSDEDVARFLDNSPEDYWYVGNAAEARSRG